MLYVETIVRELMWIPKLFLYSGDVLGCGCGTQVRFSVRFVEAVRLRFAVGLRAVFEAECSWSRLRYHDVHVNVHAPKGVKMPTFFHVEGDVWLRSDNNDEMSASNTHKTAHGAGKSLILSKKELSYSGLGNEEGR